MPPGTKKPATVSPMRPGPHIAAIHIAPAEVTDERIPMFYLPDPEAENGEREYTVPAEPDATIALKYLHIAGGGPCDCPQPHGRGELAANDYLLTELLGSDGYRALRECRGLKGGDLGAILALASKHALGALEAPKAPASA